MGGGDLCLIHVIMNEYTKYDLIFYNWYEFCGVILTFEISQLS